MAPEGFCSARENHLRRFIRFGLTILVSGIQPFAAARASVSEDVKACLVDLCGPLEHRRRLAPSPNLFPEREKGIRSFVEREAEPIVKRAIETEASALSLQLNAVEATLGDPRQAVLLPYQKSFLSLTALGKPRRLALASARWLPNWRIDFDPQTASRLLPWLPRARAQAVARFLSSVMSARNRGLMLMGQDLPFDEFVNAAKNVYGEAASGWTVQSFAGMTIDEYERNELALGPAAYFRFSGESVARFASSYQTTPYYSLAAAQLGVRAALLRSLAEPEVIAAAPASSPREAAAIANWPARAAEIRRALADPEFLDRRKREALDSCKVAIGKTLATSPTPEMLRRLEEDAAEARIAVKIAAESFLEGPALDDARRRIDSARVQMPGFNEWESRTAMRDHLNHLARERQRAKDRLEMPSIPPAHRFGLALAFTESADDPTLFSTIKSDCASFLRTQMSDAALSFSNPPFVLSSWQSAASSEVALAALAHEFGHLVEAAAGRNADSPLFAAAKRCARGRHADFRIGRDGFASAEAMEDENLADAVQERAMRIMRGRSLSPANPACLFIDSDDRSSANEPSFDRPDSRLDRHSPTLLRALQAHLGSGLEAPRSCLRALGEAKARWGKRSCSMVDQDPIP